MRVINNFAYLAGFLSDHRALKFIPELYAEVYYQIDKIICCISCRGNKVQLLVGGEDKFSREYGAEGKLEEKKTKRGLAENKAQYLFYTLVSNFSLYAYNSQEFKAETKASEAEDSWVAALFHKNDAYQTPVVLSPQRIEGNINSPCNAYLNCSLIVEKGSIRLAIQRRWKELLIAWRTLQNC